MTTPSPFPERQIPLDLVDEPELASRSEMDDAKLQALADSIRAVGVLENLILVEHGDRFRVVAGHRRSIAARLAGLVTVPAKVFPADYPHLRIMQAHENGRREDVNPVDEAFWFAELLEKDCGRDVDRLAGHVGETLNYVLGRLELLELDDETRDALRTGQIRIGVAKELRKCTDPVYRKYYLKHAIESGATTPVVDGWIRDWRRNIFEPAQGAPPAAPTPASVTSVQAYDPLRCFVCGKSDHRMTETINVHHSCREAILEPMLRDAAN